MTDIVKGMARAFAFEHDDPRDFRASEAELVEWYSPAMRAALLWLANNVSYEMVRAASEDRASDDEGQFQPLCDLIDFSGENKTHTVIKSAIAAAIRAAGEEGK